MKKNELKTYIAEEKKLYLGTDKKRIRRMRFSRHKRWCIWRALCDFRLAQYYNELRINKEATVWKRRAAKLLFRYYDRRRNRSGAVAGVELGLASKIGVCPDIWHGGVVINGTLGDHCVLHGNNVIGNKGKNGHSETPSIGSGVDIGAGAILIGAIRIADGCTVGAGAVVTRTCDIPGSVLVGVPARPMEKRQNHTED